MGTPRCMIDYDKIAHEYAAHRQIHPGVLKSLISDGKIGSSSKVLDVGCGTGNYTAALNQYANCISSGIDPSEQMLSIAKERFPSLSFQIGRAERLDFGIDYFDLVFAVDVMHHVIDRSAYFREAYRVLKNLGRVCTVTDSEWIIRNRKPLSAYFPETVAVDLKRYPTVSETKTLMKETGFCDITDSMVEFPYELIDIGAYEGKAFSSLQLISEEDFQRGLKRMGKDLAEGPIPCVSCYLLIWGIKSLPKDDPNSQGFLIRGP